MTNFEPPKKSKSGIKTPKHEVDLIKKRYREAQELAKNEWDKTFCTKNCT